MVDVDGVAAAMLLLDDDVITGVQPATLRQLQMTAVILKRDHWREWRGWGLLLCGPTRGSTYATKTIARGRPRTLNRLRLLRTDQSSTFFININVQNISLYTC